jgi:hypothetical protein
MNVIVFDHSKGAIKKYKELAKAGYKEIGEEIHVIYFKSPIVSHEARQKIVRFHPDLIITNVFPRNGVSDLPVLVNKLKRIPNATDTPIVVVSQLINNSDQGISMRDSLMGINGIVDVLSKYPTYPSFSELLAYVRKVG